MDFRQNKNMSYFLIFKTFSVHWQDPFWNLVGLHHDSNGLLHGAADSGAGLQLPGVACQQPPGVCKKSGINV